ncbi:MAG TPA: hypothetical protein VM221_12435 [Armatimonadota bacterium]|nr:hypothetical protein [Armatimonadota bacterium]
MGKALIILLGIIFLVLGIVLIVTWWDEAKYVIGTAIALTLVLIGLGMLAFGISEIRSAQEEQRLAAEAEATPPPPPVAPGASSTKEKES